ncbi:MAG TPA: iron-sulfur cluster assembly accessory protein [Myxococcales bacterium]|nr:iron-sulfur cluster assembly accessory protein [Myxococcales bacterium]
MRLSLTDRAAKAVLDRAREAEVEGWLLRIAVVAGGCNGLTYDLYFVESARPDDALVEAGRLKIAVDPASAALLDGAVIDFPRGPGFRFDNPKARRTCSCGASFET